MGELPFDAPVYAVLAAVLLVVSLGMRIVAEVVVRRRGDRISISATLWAALVLGVLTAVFDNVMIAVDLYSYAPEHLLGPHVGLAPIEDFSYPLATAIALPGVWALTRRRATERVAS